MKSFFRRVINSIRGEQDLADLVKRGLTVGKNFSRQYGCIIDSSHCWLISIGDDVILAPRVHILAHDASTKRYLGYTKIGLVKIGDKTFIGAGSIILLNVKIGSNVIIGAGSVVAKDIPDNSVAIGNPAKVVANINDYLNKHRYLMKSRSVYDESWTIRGEISPDQKKKMINDLANEIGYVD